MKAEYGLSEQKNCSRGMSGQVGVLKIKSNEMEGGGCMAGSDGKLCFSENERGSVWYDYMERITHEENYWHKIVEGDAVEGPVDTISKVKVIQV